MTVLAGVDLLGKFYAGNDEVGKVGDRFKGFITRYFQQLSQDEKEAIYQLRNALLHSFGLYSKTKSATFRFTVTCSGRALVTRADAESVLVDLSTLHRNFEDAIQRYTQDLEGSAELQANFTNMFPSYGYTNIG
jgi:hypothetical protein